MCWCFPFNLSNSKNRRTSSSGEKKRRDRPPASPLHGTGAPVVAEVQEKRRSKEGSGKRRSREPVTPRSPRREREEHRSRHGYAQYEDVYGSRDPYRPALNVQVPDMWHRNVHVETANSSQEALLNPRPHRSPHHRQRQPKRTSQGTLRGRGAKRDPPRHSKSKKSLRNEPVRQGGWSLFAPSPPKTPSRRDHRSYQTLDSSPRSHRSPRSHHSSSQDQTPSHRHRSHQSPQQASSSSRRPHSDTPNTAARRVPDRRFAVLAATNAALEDLRREAFAQPSPPPRRERLQRYQGVTIPSSSIPFNWDCVSSSQASGGGGGRGEPSTRHRRSSRR